MGSFQNLNRAPKRSNLQNNFRLCRTASTLPPKRRKRDKRGIQGLEVYNLDAAQPFDLESRLEAKARKERSLKIGIVGFGTFGQFLAKRFLSHGHNVIATSRGDYTSVAAEIGATFYSDIDDFCEEHPDVVMMCTSIISTEKALMAIPFQRLKRSTLFVDVLSVKEFPKRLFLNKLPRAFDILCLHPMFGPDSGRYSWANLPLMYEEVRISSSPKRKQTAETVLGIFEAEGCRMVEMSCEEHDRQAASTQFITHTVGRMLGEMGLYSTTINTKGYESLLSLVNNTANDSFDLYYGLFMYNQNSTEELQRLEQAFDKIRQALMSKLHEKLRGDIFGATPAAGAGERQPGRADAEVLPPPPPRQLSDGRAGTSSPSSGTLHGTIDMQSD
uniref:Arogenate dehydrogenase (NADP+), plant n=1 Tax=Tetraselmis sp. GSL018 TaxID=582737 RepID=A0A061QVW7_9CHLO